MSIVTPAPGSTAQPLSLAMRDGSRQEHDDAENSPFLGELLDGRVSDAGYAAYLRRLRVLYATMESVIRERRGDRLVAAVADSDLERLAAIDADLAVWAPQDPTSTSSAAAADYRDRLLSVADDGRALIAHHYTRYLGDLSGGQAIGRILDRTFELGGRGVAFYAFPAIPKPKPYKDRYRARLDALDLSPRDLDAVVDEVKVAFQLNQAIFDELGGRLDRYRRVPD